MTTRFINHGFWSVAFASLGACTCFAADATSMRTESARATAPSTASRSTRPGPARGPLPDPALLDGAAQQAEKKSEYGMLGEFELPGDENVREGKPGGQQNQNPQMAGGAGGQPQQQQGGGGGAQGDQGQQQGGQGQAGGAQGAQGGQAGGQQQAGGAQGGGAPGGTEQAGAQGAGGAGPQGAMGAAGTAGGGAIDQAQGIQVAGLEGDAGGQAGPGGPGGTKPQQVAIGDATMRIQTVANPSGVVGGQPAGQTQEHLKGTGTGGKGPSGAGSNANRGAEKGRVMPSGL